MRFPSSPENFTPEWLSHELGASVSAFEIEQIGIGVGLLGRLFRLTLTSDGGPPSVVAKVPTLDAGARTYVAEPLRFYEKEVRFYRELSADVPIATPKAFFAEHDASTGDFTLLLEDLGDRRMEDQIVGCASADATTVVDALVDLHSHWWNRADFPEWLPTYSDPPYPQVIAGMYKQSWPRALEIFEGHFAAEYLEFGERFAELVPWFLDNLAGGPQSFCHGDFRLDNLFFGTRTEHAPVAAVDWQICFRGRPAYDLAYFISQSIDTSPRRECEQMLRNRYLEGLAQRGAIYDEAQFLEDYRRTVAYCFIYAVVTAGQIEMANERQRELVLGIGDRAVQAMEDNDALAVLPS